MQRLFILCFLISPHLFLAGCKQSVRQIQSVDPIVGAWITFDETRIIVNADGSGIQKFEREMYYELNKTCAGIETKLSWNSMGDSKYTIFYEGSKSPELCVIENGQLIFDQGDYIYGKLLKGADPKTFTIDESEPDAEIYTMMDANHKWKFDPPAWPQLVQ